MSGRLLALPLTDRVRERLPQARPPASVLKPTPSHWAGPTALRRAVSPALGQTAWRHLARAWDAVLYFRFDEGCQHIGAAEWAIGDAPPATAAALRNEIILLRASVYALKDESAAALAVARQYVGPKDAGLSPARVICRYALWKQGDFEALRAYPPRIAREGLRPRATALAAMDLAIDAAVCLEQARLPLAKRLALGALQLAETAPARAGGPAALAASIAAQIAYEEGQIDEAERLIVDRLPAIRAQGNIECAIRAFEVLARIAVSRHRPDVALLILDDAEALGVRRGWPRLVAATLSRRVELLIARNQAPDAQATLVRLQSIAASPGAGDYLANDEVRRRAVLAGLQLACSVEPTPRLAEQYRLLQSAAIERGDILASNRLAIEIAATLATLGQAKESEAWLIEALHFGSRAGLFMTFVESAPIIRNLLATLRDRGPDAGDDGVLALYLASLLCTAGPESADLATNRPSARPSLISTREAGILRLVAAGLPNKCIAQTLGIAPETVKSHAKNIFIKLSARTRTEAVHRAQRLGLI